MFVKTFSLGLVTIATLGAAALTASADTATMQTTTQDVYIEGSRNTALQENRQENRLRVKNASARGGDHAVVQDSLQQTSIYGRNNQVGQRTIQANVSEIINRSGLKR
jgi:hypothetical protein